MAAVLASVQNLQVRNRTSEESGKSGSHKSKESGKTKTRGSKETCKDGEDSIVQNRHDLSEAADNLEREINDGSDNFEEDELQRLPGVPSKAVEDHRKLAPIIPSPPVVSDDDDDDSDGDLLEADTFRQHLYLFLEEPESSTGARVISHMILYTIVISIASFVLETLPDLKDFRLWKIIEPVTTIIFTLEYIGRLLVCDAFPLESELHRTKCEFIRSPMNILDLLAILPFYLEVAAQELMKSVRPLRVLRAVRLIRCFRIFKLSKYSLGMTIMVESLHNSIQPLSILTFFLFIGVVLTSSLMYFAERTGCPDVQHMLNTGTFQKYHDECKISDTGRDSHGHLCCNKHGSALDFESIYRTFWWSMVTMTTVGYGDKVPRTLLGRLVGAFAMVSGIILISLPVAVVASNFQQTYDLLKQEEDADDLLDEQENEERQRRLADHETDNAADPKHEHKQHRQDHKHVVVVDHNHKAKDTERHGPQLPRPLLQDGKQEDIDRVVSNLSVMSSLDSAEPHHGYQSEKPTDSRKKLASLRETLKAFDERNTRLSDKARRELFLVLELLDHIERVEKQLKGLREKDTQISVAVRKEFVALSKSYEVLLRNRGGSFDQ